MPRALQTQRTAAHRRAILKNVPSGPRVHHKPTTQAERNAATASGVTSDASPLDPALSPGQVGSGHSRKQLTSSTHHTVLSCFLRHPIPRVLGRATR